MDEIKRNVKDSVFTKMFKDKKYLIQLYESLHPEDKVTEDDLEIVSIENVLINGAYNDLGFLVRNKLFVLVEAQSTWSMNILVRMFIYLAKTYQEYIYSNKILVSKLYSETKLKLPEPELYVIYAGTQEDKKSVISLKEEFFEEKQYYVDLKINVIFADKHRRDIIGQYLGFCVILKEQMKIFNGDKRKAINETIKTCIEEGNLVDFLSDNKKEVEDYMFALLNQEEAYKAAIDYTKLNALEALIRNLKEFLPSFEEVYAKVSSEDIYSEFSREIIKEIYEQS